MQMDLELAKYLLAGAMLQRRDDEFKNENDWIEKIFTVIRPKDKLKERTILPEPDIPLPEETKSGMPAPLKKIHEPFGGKAIIKNYKVRFEIDQDTFEFDQTKTMDNLTKRINKIEKRALQYHATQVFNRGFDSNYPGLDKVPLFSTAHEVKAGGYNANCFSTSNALNATNVENLVGLMNTNINNAGVVSPIDPKFLLVGAMLRSSAVKICKSTQMSGTANNDTNFLKEEIGLIPIVLPDLAYPTRYMVAAPAENNGMFIYITKDVVVNTDTDIINGVYIFVFEMAFDIGWYDHRGIAGDMGA